MRILLTAIAALSLPLVTATGIAQAAQATPAASPSAHSNNGHTNNGQHKGQVKKLQSGTLTESQVKDAIEHPQNAIAKLRGMHTVKFDQLRIYRLPSNLKYLVHHASTAELAYTPFVLRDAVAQTSSLSPLLNILADINVQDALNGSLNGNNVNLSLTDVLNGNNIAVGQVVGVYVGGGGIITTIIG